MRSFVNREGEVLWDIPAGKPNPAERFPGIGVEDTRTRVRALGQKEATSEYYALNLFRPRIGKHLESDPELRRIERLFSQHRKNYVALLDERQSMQIQSENLFKLMEQRDKQTEQQVLMQLNMSFCPKLARLHESLLQDVLFDLEAYYQRYHAAPDRAPTYQQLKPWEKQAISGLAVMQARLTQYPNLCISSWCFREGPEALMHELRTFGPMLARGYYGSDFYKPNSAFVMRNRIGGQAIHAWRSQDYDWQKAATHSVVVVGMTQEAGQYRVIFLDPKDASNPDEQRKYYLISYERFISNMRNLHGTQAVKTEEPGTDCLIRDTGLVFR